MLGNIGEHGNRRDVWHIGNMAGCTPRPLPRPCGIAELGRQARIPCWTQQVPSIIGRTLGLFPIGRANGGGGRGEVPRLSVEIAEKPKEPDIDHVKRELGMWGGGGWAASLGDVGQFPKHGCATPEGQGNGRGCGPTFGDPPYPKTTSSKRPPPPPQSDFDHVYKGTCDVWRATRFCFAIWGDFLRAGRAPALYPALRASPKIIEQPGNTRVRPSLQGNR